MIDLAKTVHQLHYFISFDSEARKDICVHLEYEVSMIQTPMVSSDEFTLFTDDSVL